MVSKDYKQIMPLVGNPHALNLSLVQMLALSVFLGFEALKITTQIQTPKINF